MTEAEFIGAYTARILEFVRGATVLWAIEGDELVIEVWRGRGEHMGSYVTDVRRGDVRLMSPLGAQWLADVALSELTGAGN